MAIVFIPAIAIRLIYGLVPPEEYRDPDEVIYTTMADNLLTGKGLILNDYRRAAFPPLYPAFLAGLRLVGVGSIRGVRLVQAFLGAASCLWLLGITRLVFSLNQEKTLSAVPLTAALLMAVYPPHIYYCASLLTETLFVFILLAGIYSLLRSLETGGLSYRLPLAGILLGLGILCRPTLLPFALIIPFWLWIARPGKAWFVRRMLSFLLPLILVLLPWGIRNYRLFQRIVPVTTQAGNILYLANNPLATGGTVSISYFLEGGVYHLGDEEDEVTYSREYGDRAFRFIAETPGRFLFLSLKRLAWFYHLDVHYPRVTVLLIFWGILGLAIAGVRLTRKEWRRSSLLLLLIACFTLIHMVFPPEGRYRLPIMPAIFAFAGFALVKLGRLLKFRGHNT